jgi:hypothetical protein
MVTGWTVIHILTFPLPNGQVMLRKKKGGKGKHGKGSLNRGTTEDGNLITSIEGSADISFLF